MPKSYGNAPLLAGITAFFMAGLLWAGLCTSESNGKAILFWGLISTAIVGGTVTVTALPPQGK
jgi:hypothetical protein